MSQDTTIREYEKAFRRAGLPNLIENYSAAEDIFTRALPLLTLIFVLEIFNALNLDYPWWVNVLFFIGGVAISLGAFGLLNVSGGRPFLSRPSRVGRSELAIFIAIPAIEPLLFGGQWKSAVVTMAGNVAILVALYLVVGYGLVPILRWAGARFATQLRASLTLLVRALPLLLFFALVTFFANEYWQMFGNASRQKFIAAIALFAMLGAGFLLVRNPSGVRELEREASQSHPLTARQRTNVGLVIFVNQAVQIAFVALAVWLFFMIFGALLVDLPIVRSWVGHTPHVLFTLPLFGDSVSVTQELLRVASGTAAFSGLYYAVAMVVDSNYRDEFVTQITDQMRETFAMRADYLRLLDRSREGSAVP
ncbi:MAG: hypothetical protein QOG88_1675 [Actinomycetota bacterium]|nr:hypothetical protein [Actinomycetota bacterium]